MKRTSTQNLSAMMDGELARDELQDLVHDLATDDGLKDRWENYHLIGDTLRKNLPPYILPDLSDRISEALQNEPVHFPRRQEREDQSSAVSRRRAAFGFALAASVTALAVVGMLQFNGPVQAPGQGPVAVAANDMQQTGSQQVQQAAARPAAEERTAAPVVYASVALADASGAPTRTAYETDPGVDYPGEPADLYDYLVNYQRYAQTVSLQSGFHPAIQLVGYTPQ